MLRFQYRIKTSTHPQNILFASHAMSKSTMKSFNVKKLNYVIAALTKQFILIVCQETFEESLEMTAFGSVKDARLSYHRNTEMSMETKIVTAVIALSA